METYLTIEELAGYLKLAEQTVRRWVMNGQIPFHKIKSVIRFRLSEIENWVDCMRGVQSTPRQIPYLNNNHEVVVDNGGVKTTAVESDVADGGLFNETDELQELEAVDGEGEL